MVKFTRFHALRLFLLGSLLQFGIEPRRDPGLPIGSMVLLYMVTWIPSIYPLYVSIYSSAMDPSWVMTSFIWEKSQFLSNKEATISDSRDRFSIHRPCDYLFGMTITDWWLEHEFYDFPYIGNVIIPTDCHIFQRDWNHQSDQFWSPDWVGWSMLKPHFPASLVKIHEINPMKSIHWFHRKELAPKFLKLFFFTPRTIAKKHP